MQYSIETGDLDSLLVALDRLERRVKECLPVFRDAILKDVDAQQALTAASVVRKARDAQLQQTS